MYINYHMMVIKSTFIFICHTLIINPVSLWLYYPYAVKVIKRIYHLKYNTAVCTSLQYYLPNTRSVYSIIIHIVNEYILIMVLYL